MTIFYSLFISFSALHLGLIAKRLASVTTDTSFNVFGLTRLRIEPSLPASKRIEPSPSLQKSTYARGSNK